MGWKNWIGECGAEHVERIEEQLFALGAVSVTFEDRLNQPIFEPMPGEMRLWALVKVKALFDDQKELDGIAAAISPIADMSNVSIEPVPDKNWVRESMDQFTAQRFGERLWVVPSWLQPPVDANAVVVELDPGVAFGTGTHPTTAMCLEWLDRSNVEKKSVLDFGCGSGILAVAALKLGAKEVVAVDIDPQALDATQDNAVKNSVSSHIKIGLPSVLEEERFDIVMANILAGPLLSLSRQLVGHLCSEGMLVLSGLLDEQASEVKNAYPDIEWLEDQSTDEWICLVGRRISF